MKRSIPLLAATLLWSTAAPGVQAAEVAGVRIEETARSANADLVLNGAGLRSKVFFKVYAAALYAPRKTTKASELLDSREPRRMALHLLRDIDAETLLGALDEGLRGNLNEAEQAALKGDIARFSAIMRSVGNARSGDLIVIDFATEGTTVSLNGQAKGTVAGPAFANALLRVWLGDRPAQADLKQALLGG